METASCIGPVQTGALLKRDFRHKPIKMNKTLLCVLLSTAIIAFTSCSSEKAEKEENEHGHNHEDEISMTAEQVEKLGVKTEKVAPSEFRQVVKCGGEVTPATSSQYVVSALSDGVVTFSPGINTGVKVGKGSPICGIESAGISGGDARVEARLRLEAARKEYARVEGLYKSNLATEKELQEARLALDVAKNAVAGNTSGSTSTSGISGVVGQLLVENGSYVSVGTPIAVVYSDNRLRLRVTVPQRYYNDYATFTTANFTLPYTEETFALDEMGGKKLSSATTAVVNQGYFNMEFEFVNNGNVTPGSYAEVYLLGAQRTGVISVPLKSIVEEQGKYSVFVLADEPNHYEKLPVTVGGTDGKRIEIVSGLEAGREVVVEGATYVKLAANSGVVPEGHHHH